MHCSAISKDEQADAATRLTAIFAAANLTQTQGCCERPAGFGSSDLFCRWMTETHAVFVALADPDADKVDAAALAHRLQGEVAEVTAPVHAQDRWCLCAIRS